MSENKNNNLIKSEEETEEQVKKILKFLLQIEKVENIVFFIVSLIILTITKYLGLFPLVALLTLNVQMYAIVSCRR